MRPAIQLYSLRDLDEPLTMTLRRVNEAGFEGVEFANRLTDENAAAVAEELESTGLVPLAAHVGWNDLRTAAESAGDLDALLAKYGTVGCHTVVIPHVSDRLFSTERQLKSFVSTLADLQSKLEAREFDLWYHNQGSEFVPVATGRAERLVEAADRIPGPGMRVAASLFQRRTGDPTLPQTGFGALVRSVAPLGVGFEVDTGHVANAGYDPVAAIGCVDELGGTVGAVHITDDSVAYADERGLDPGSLVDRIESAAGKYGAEWMIYEEDHPDTPSGALRRGTALLVDRAATLDAVTTP
jgi:sugar phosphate isomerase/epimerase